MLSLAVAPTEGTGPADDSTPRVDRFGDSLPDGAAARLGTIRWRYPRPAEFIHFIGDGKLLLSCCGDGIIHVSDAASAKLIRRFGNRDGCLESASEDGAFVAQVTPDGKAHVWSVSTGKETGFFDLGFKENVRGLCFIKGGQLLSWGDDCAIKVWDIGTGKLSRMLLDRAPALQKSVDQDYIFQLAVSPDGTTLAFTIGQWKSKDKGVFSLSVWGLKDDKPRGEIELAWDSGGAGYTSPVFSPDGKYFAWPEKDGTIHLYESASLKKVRTLGTDSGDGRVEGACFSGDGKTLAALTPRQTIRLLDVATGRQLREIGETVRNDEYPGWRQARSRFLGGSTSAAFPSCCSFRLAWSPTSNLIAQAWGPRMIRIWDAETGKGTDPGTAPVGTISGLIVSGDGKSAVTLGEDNTVRTWDVQTTTEQRRIFLPPNTDYGILLRSGRGLLHSSGGSWSIWDIETEEEIVQVQRDKERYPNNTRYDVSTDGQSLLTVEYTGLQGTTNPRHATLYNLETGAVSPGVAKNWIREDKEEELLSLAHACTRHSVVATIAARGRPKFGLGTSEYRYLIRCKQSEDDPMLLWKTKDIELDFGYWRAVSFTPDDRAILTLHRDKTTYVSLLESITGNERCRFRIHDYVPACYNLIHAFSRNGDLLAVGSSDGTTTVFDIRRGREIATLTGDQGAVRCLAFGADAATLFSAGSNGTVLIWDLHEHLRKSRRVVELSSADGKRLWAELADPDTVKTYRAVGALVTAPAQAVDLLREKLTAVEKVPDAEIDKLIIDLDNDEFATRQKASRELRRIGPQAKAALQKTLEKSESREQRRRVEELLVELKERETKPSPDELRELRAVEVLEAIGTPPARSILESLAKGAPGTRLTDEAAAALERQNKNESLPYQKR
jgi:WD40 repeat protein